MLNLSSHNARQDSTRADEINKTIQSTLKRNTNWLLKAIFNGGNRWVQSVLRGWDTDIHFTQSSNSTLWKSITVPHLTAQNWNSMQNTFDSITEKLNPTGQELINGEAERFMKTLENCIRSAHIERKNWERRCTDFFVNTDQRNTHQLLSLMKRLTRDS